MGELVELGELCDPELRVTAHSHPESQSAMNTGHVHTTATERWHAFAAELGTMPDVIERLSAIHRPTVDGRLCRGCTAAGRGTPYLPWPCPIAALLAAGGPPAR
jgi:hypothetical protein